MILSGFGVTLVRILHEDIELVRQHRNSAQINQFMEFRGHISSEEQEKWFQSVNNAFNNYFIIHFKKEKCGLIYGAEIDWKKKETGNGGIFIWNENFLKTPVPLAASLLLTEISFLLGLERTYIKVLRDNLRAVAYNRNLGYELLPGQENIINQRYVLTAENYSRCAKRFRDPLVKMYGEIFSMTLDHPGDEAEMNILAVYNTQPDENKKRLQLHFK